MSCELLFLTCPPRVVVPLVKYGVLSKGSDGFVVIACPTSHSFPAPFLQSIQQDEEITGYILIPSDNPILPETEV